MVVSLEGYDRPIPIPQGCDTTNKIAYYAINEHIPEGDNLFVIDSVRWGDVIVAKTRATNGHVIYQLVYVQNEDERTLSAWTYRNAELDLEVRGVPNFVDRTLFISSTEELIGFDQSRLSVITGVNKIIEVERYTLTLEVPDTFEMGEVFDDVARNIELWVTTP